MIQTDHRGFPDKSITKDQWREEQIVAVLYRNARGAMTGSMIGIALLAYVLSTVYPGFGIFIWFLVGEALNLARWLVHRRYMVSPKRYSPRTWMEIHRWFTLASGCMYGLLAVFFFSSTEPLYQALVTFLVGGMGAAAVGTHGADRITYHLFLFPSLIPLLGRAILEGTEVHTTLAIMLLLLGAVMLRSAKQTREILLENIDMSYSLHYRATHDGLVGLLNRDEFHNLFQREIAAAPKSNTLTAMMFIDLDNFKTLNDTYGHKAGDEALVEIGDIIRHSIRRSDIAARFGGDEFMILVQSEQLEDIRKIAEKILTRLDEFQQQSDRPQAPLGASIGICYGYNGNLEFETMLQTADKACYEAKRAGKGQIVMTELS